MRNKNHLILLFILITGSVLRLVFLDRIPFTHDEFSAMARLHFGSFAELIEKGVKIDGHPAGVQVFLYYWTALAGWSEIAIKLPFIFMGIASIGLIFLIGKAWFNETLGLMAAAFMASMQFTVTYSQIARPYASGLFLCLAMVLCWTYLVFQPGRPYWLYYVLFILTAALCAYNHHFSLMFAAITGLTGLFFVRGKKLVLYILSGLAIFALYIPHLPIFFFQLSVGGVESWLTKPHNDFLLRFLQYLFHFSNLVYLLILLLFVAGFILRKKAPYPFRFLVISFAWFFIPLIVGYYYSVYSVSVLQASLLIFSFPYLIFILFGHYPACRFRTNAVLVLLILGVNTGTLIFERQHFALVSVSPYEQILKEHQDLRVRYPGKVLSLIDSHRDISDYYIKRGALSTQFSWLDSIGNTASVCHFLRMAQERYDYLYFGALSESNPVWPALIRDYFPIVQWQKNFCGGSAWLFAKQGKEAETPIYQSRQDFESTHACWNPPESKFITDSVSCSPNHAWSMTVLQKYGPGFLAFLKDITRHENNVIDIAVNVHSCDTLGDAQLVCQLEGDGFQINWSSARLADYASNPVPGHPGWFRVHHSLKLADVHLGQKLVKFNVYIWNEQRKSFAIDDLEVRVREGNPLIYGLTEKIY